MNIARTVDELRRLLQPARRDGRRIGFVPTMGALHEGHRRLIRAARQQVDASGPGGLVVVSIFVNPTQFGPNEDYQQYPRPLQDDLAACEAEKVDVVFCPHAAEIYIPRTGQVGGVDAKRLADAGPTDGLTTVHVDQLQNTLCGRSRPGHFDGVTTVVTKLFNIIMPHAAFFGQKDFQQSAIIRRMIYDLNMPVELYVVETVREADGLALSSRNRYLSAAHRHQAAALWGALKLAEQCITRSQPPATQVLQAMRDHLAEHAPDGQVDYIQLVDPVTLRDVETTDQPVVAALAVRFGSARLIDNLPIDPT